MTILASDRKIPLESSAFNQLTPQAHQGYAKGNLEKALLEFQKQLFLNPNDSSVYSNLGVIFSRLRQFEKADKFFEKALSLNPNSLITLNNYSNSLQKQDRLEEALRICEQALSQDPNFIGVLLNKALVHRKLGEFEKALTLFKKILLFKPDYADAHFNVGFCLLYQRDWENAWPEYEWRWQMEEAKGNPPLPTKKWAGESLKDKTILIYNEQGFGDTLQMSRYADLLHQQKAQVILKCQPSMGRLLKFTQGVSRVVYSFEEVGSYDYQIPLFSLPHLCKTTPQTIPNQVPYIALPIHPINFTLKKNKKIKIGLVWSTNRTSLITRTKSIAIEELIPLLEIQEAQFFSLQVDEQAQDVYHPEVIYHLMDLSPHIRDFYDTAQIIQNLDLVISVDTATAHLAGALNRPVWVLLSQVPDWRWGMESSTSAWYPSMRLFRQKKRGEWSPVITEVKKALQKLLQSR